MLRKQENHHFALKKKMALTNKKVNTVFLWSCTWKLDDKFRAHPFFTFHTDLPLKGMNDLVADHHPESCPLFLQGIIRGPKSLDLFRVHADSLILDGKPDISIDGLMT
jgi:hypothetical protein